MRVTILEQDYQRNGVSGDGFFVFRIRLDMSEHEDIEVIRTLLVTVDTFPDEDGGRAEYIDATTCRVVDPLDLSAHWRGDEIGDELHRALLEGDYDPHARVTHMCDRYMLAAHAAVVHARGNLWCPACNLSAKAAREG